MKRSTRLRSGLITAALVAVTAVGWIYLAPSNIGGSTSYIVTHGISMEPRFHTGDLAIVRPAPQYKIGDIVAYHSTLLHVIVLHRIVARYGDRYAFKADNNNFLDPVRPTRSQLVGALWFRVPHGGRVLAALHEPVAAATICALLGLFLFVGIRETGRRRERGRRSAAGSRHRGVPSMSERDQNVPRAVNFGAFLGVALGIAAALAVLALFAFSRPVDSRRTVATPYTEEVSFGYSAHVRPTPVYPNGAVNTGDPIFLSLVHRFQLHIAYQLTSSASSTLAGTEDVILKLLGPSGWTRNFVLVPATHFTGGHASTDVTVDIPQLQALLARIERLTGSAANFSISVGPRIRTHGAIANQPIRTIFKPTVTFELVAGQLQVGSGDAPSTASTGPEGSQGSYAQFNKGSVSIPSSTPATITVLGVSPRIELLRWIAVLGLVLSVAAAIYFYLRKRSEPFEETSRIQAQYGYMIVPIVGGEDLGWPPVDVPSIKSLVRLAEAGQRLILHNRSGNVDTYMLNEEGTVYRYQVKPSKVVWGEWSAPAPPLEEAA